VIDVSLLFPAGAGGLSPQIKKSDFQMYGSPNRFGDIYQFKPMKHGQWWQRKSFLRIGGSTSCFMTHSYWIKSYFKVGIIVRVDGGLFCHQLDFSAGDIWLWAMVGQPLDDILGTLIILKQMQGSLPSKT
jgi:hypothetical protein